MFIIYYEKNHIVPKFPSIEFMHITDQFQFTQHFFKNTPIFIFNHGEKTIRR